MQIKVISVPVQDGAQANEELNTFLRGKKVLQVEQQLVQGPQGAYWTFCIRYTEDFSPRPKQGKIDYKEVLDPITFARFSKLRELRKQAAAATGDRVYMIFTNAELAELAKHEHLTRSNMLAVKGIGEQKLAKYGAFFLAPETETDASNQSTAEPDR